MARRVGALMPYVCRAGVRLAGYTAALAGYRRLLLDNRGHGRSDRPSGLSAHRLGEYVEDVIAVLDSAGVHRAALVGYSAGARVAYAVARRHPGRVSAVAGIGSGGAPGDYNRERAGWAAEVRAGGMRAAMQELAAGEPEPAPGWLLDNLAGTAADMFALLLEAWASEPAAWADFPLCEPRPWSCAARRRSRGQRGMPGWPLTHCPMGRRSCCPACGTCRRSGGPTRRSRRSPISSASTSVSAKTPHLRGVTHRSPLAASCRRTAVAGRARLSLNAAK